MRKLAKQWHAADQEVVQSKYNMDPSNDGADRGVGAGEEDCVNSRQTSMMYTLNGPQEQSESGATHK